PDHPNPLPKEIALTILVNKGPRVPEVMRLLDWQDHPDHFIMVLECPYPCENLVQFMRRHGGRLDEEKARHIMRQAAHAVNMCCLREVLHRDIKLDNLLINSETSEEFTVQVILCSQSFVMVSLAQKCQCHLRGSVAIRKPEPFCLRSASGSCYGCHRRCLHGRPHLQALCNVTSVPECLSNLRDSCCGHLKGSHTCTLQSSLSQPPRCQYSQFWQPQ
ncbi:Serine/threonine-protein kinase pim-2, partial [Anabarilius grahami]